MKVTIAVVTLESRGHWTKLIEPTIETLDPKKLFGVQETEQKVFRIGQNRGINVPRAHLFDEPEKMGHPRFGLGQENQDRS